MAYSVRTVGLPRETPVLDSAGDLLLRCVGEVANSVVTQTSARDADLTIIHPYHFPFTSTAAGSALESIGRLAPIESNPDALLRRIYGIPAKSAILAVSQENLDRRPWQAFGNLIRKGSVPRLTFWPHEIDPGGFRFPYWWNYVDWPELPRSFSAVRNNFGRLYNLTELIEPQIVKSELDRRQNRAVWLTRHRDFPREPIHIELEKSVPVDVVGNLAFGQKAQVLSRYRYCVVTENSTGYGYETEKLPDAKSAGCIPIGHVPNPLGDFNARSAYFRPPEELPDVLPPMLNERPLLSGLLDYLSLVLDRQR